MVISKETIIFQGSLGVQLFPGRGGGSNCLFSIGTHITCDFPGGVRTPPPPLDPRMLIGTEVKILKTLLPTRGLGIMKRYLRAYILFMLNTVF